MRMRIHSEFCDCFSISVSQSYELFRYNLSASDH